MHTVTRYRCYAYTCLSDQKLVYTQNPTDVRRAHTGLKMAEPTWIDVVLDFSDLA